jgi:hypothetical protein
MRHQRRYCTVVTMRAIMDKIGIQKLLIVICVIKEHIIVNQVFTIIIDSEQNAYSFIIATHCSKNSK